MNLTIQSRGTKIVPILLPLSQALGPDRESDKLMDVRIFHFPQTKVAVAEHRGPPELEYETSRKLIEWRKENRVPPGAHQTYGVHYTDPHTTLAADHRVDFCVSFEHPVLPNPQGIVGKVIPAGRCAVARHLGSRSHNLAAVHLFRHWLPQSGESAGNFPVFFHYVNVGPDVREQEMVTDVYLPLASADGTLA